MSMLRREVDTLRDRNATLELQVSHRYLYLTAEEIRCVFDDI